MMKLSTYEEGYYNVDINILEDEYTHIRMEQVS